jgi:arylsulfatase A-like enzyme
MSSQSRETPKQNIIWIFGDQHRAQAQGYMGDPNVFTPNLDRLANESLLPSGIGGCPLCCPYRGSLLTSRYPHECVPGHEDPLPADLPTVAAPFTEAGYDTAWFGKWHLGGINESQQRSALQTVPKELRGGFQTWIGYDNNNSQYDSWVHGHEADGTEVSHYQLEGYETDVLTSMLIDYIAEHDAAAAQPFFAALSVQPPHDPYTAPESFMAQHNAGSIEWRENVPDVEWVRRQASQELAGYYAMIENIDWNLGRVRTALASAGLTENTHIIFFSDHGEMHGSHGMFRKTNPYEEAIRVPMIIGGTTPHYGIRRGERDLLVNHVDVAPTSLGLAGIPVPDWMRGTDYSAARLMSTDGDPGRNPESDYPDSAFLQIVRPTMHGDSVDRPWRGVVTRDGWKYVCLEHQPWLMFDLNTDPYEQVNLAHNTRFAAERRRLHERLARWIAETGDEFDLPEL